MVLLPDKPNTPHLIGPGPIFNVNLPDDVVRSVQGSLRPSLQVRVLQPSANGALRFFSGVCHVVAVWILSCETRSRYSPVQLYWALSQGSATVRVVFDAGWKNLTATTLQAVILLTLGKHASLKASSWLVNSRASLCVCVKNHIVWANTESFADAMA